MAETVKVKLYLHENDEYNELWKEVEGKRYFARHTYKGSIWYYVCDPWGFRELDRPCENDLTFIVCDQKGNPLFEDSNATDFVFPTLDGAAALKWATVQDKYPVQNDLIWESWLLSYMTPENLAKDPAATQFCPEDNWTLCWFDMVDHKAVETFEYLGETYAIWAIRYRHRYCDCEWTSYMSGYLNMDWEYPSFILLHGDQFDDVYGPMYSRADAIYKVSNALREIYNNKSLSRISGSIGYHYELKLSYHQAAEILINGDLHRAHIDEVINNEKKKHSFYNNREDMKRDYPGYVPDLSVNRWW